MIKGKKGKVEAQKVTVSLLVLIIIVLFFAFFSPRVSDWMTSKGDVESCRLSVVASGKISDVSMGISTLDLECPRKNIVLSAESYTVDDSEKEYTSDDDEDYAANVKQVFAEEMRECWYKMGEGKIDPFASSYLTFDSVCIVCSQIHFENPVKEDVGNLYDYLQETKIPLSVQTQETITYHDYLFWIRVADALNTAPLTTSTDYTVFFVSFIPPKQEVWKDPSHAIAVYSSEALSTSQTCDYIYS